jgi:hypothetical protein
MLHLGVPSTAPFFPLGSLGCSSTPSREQGPHGSAPLSTAFGSRELFLPCAQELHGRACPSVHRCRPLGTRDPLHLYPFPLPHHPSPSKTRRSGTSQPWRPSLRTSLSMASEFPAPSSSIRKQQPYAAPLSELAPSLLFPMTSAPISLLHGRRPAAALRSAAAPSPPHLPHKTAPEASRCRPWPSPIPPWPPSSLSRAPRNFQQRAPPLRAVGRPCYYLAPSSRSELHHRPAQQATCCSSTVLRLASSSSFTTLLPMTSSPHPLYPPPKRQAPSSPGFPLCRLHQPDLRSPNPCNKPRRALPRSSMLLRLAR